MFGIATRGSPLARWQAELVREHLRRAGPDLDVQLVVVDTSGDRRRDVPIQEIGGQGVFAKEVQEAVLDGRAAVAVHSAKDLPSGPAPGLVLAAVPVRADPRDALVGSTLAGLAPGAIIATGSVRRRAQLAWLRPDLTFTSLRGNIGTRLDKVPPGGAVVVARAALDRLGLADRAAETLDPSLMLPQVGQGAIAVECREDDAQVLSLLGRIDDAAAHQCVSAERGFLARLGGGCDLPVGAHARLVEGGRDGGRQLEIEGLIASPDGRMVLRTSRIGAPADGPALGVAVAEHLLGAGGAELLE